MNKSGIEDLIFITAPIVIIGTDNQGLIRFVNPAVYNVFGYFEGEVEGEQLSVLIPELASLEYSDFETTVQRGEVEILDDDALESFNEPESPTKPIAEFNYLERFVFGKVQSGKKGHIQTTNKKGEQIWIDISISQMENTDSKMYCVIINDITENKKYEHAIKIAKEDAEIANKIKSEFLGNISHELHTPMNGILGITELLLEFEQPPESLELLETLQQSSQSLLHTIDEILDFSEIDRDKLVLKCKEFDIRKVLNNTVKVLKLNSEKKALEFNYRIDDSVPVLLKGDPHRLEQITLNLVGNAIKYTEHGKVDFVLEKLEDQSRDGCIQLHFIISDTGIGITKDKQQTIFCAFSQADGSITRKYNGVGLGLTISAQLVKLMGGSIWVESSLGYGSTFHFTICFGIIDIADSE